MNRTTSHKTSATTTPVDASEEPGAWRYDLRHASNGLLMGAADIIPGVSGGTVALILGIYTRLVTAISHFDAHLVRLLLQRQWKRAFHHIDARFLLTLGTGIATGIIGLARSMRYLLEFHHLETLAVFFGLILGSSVLVAQRIRVPRASGVWVLGGIGLVAAVFAYWLVGLPLLQPKDETVSLGYVFLCGVIAICAMILPGVSGAYFLLVLGLYYYVTDIIHRVTELDATMRDLATMVIFALGCAMGLIGFSKILRWLLARFEMLTMAVLCGLMVGSLRRVWPFQVDTTPDIVDFKKKVFDLVLPTELSADVWTAIVLAGVAGVAVVLLDYAANHWMGAGGGGPERSLGSPAE